MATYLHSIPLADHRHHVHQVEATWNGTYFIFRDKDHATGKTHELYFKTLDEFSQWHYEQLGWYNIEPQRRYANMAKEVWMHAG